MRLIKVAVTGAVGLFIVITLFSLLIPFHVRVSRIVLINSLDSVAIRQQVADLQSWKNWHPVFTGDSATLDCSNGSGKPAFCTILHRGKQANISLPVTDSNSIKFLLRASGENDIDNEVVIRSLPAQGSTEVEWRAVTHLRWYPWDKFYGIFIDRITGPGYEAALNGLKTFTEHIPPAKMQP